MKQILIDKKGETNSNAIILGDTPLPSKRKVYSNTGLP